MRFKDIEKAVRLAKDNLTSLDCKNADVLPLAVAIMNCKDSMFGCAFDLQISTAVRQAGDIIQKEFGTQPRDAEFCLQVAQLSAGILMSTVAEEES